MPPPQPRAGGGLNMIYSICTAVWNFLELVIYNTTTPRDVDAIICLFLSSSIFLNVQLIRRQVELDSKISSILADIKVYTNEEEQ
jgi:hypothetical protein